MSTGEREDHLLLADILFWWWRDCAESLSKIDNLRDGSIDDQMRIDGRVCYSQKDMYGRGSVGGKGGGVVRAITRRTVDIR